MKSKAITSTMFGILSIQNLLATSAQAASPVQPEGQQVTQATQSHVQVNTIIQKRIVGFDPKQAVETLTYLSNVGVRRFENDGSIQIPKHMVATLMDTASVDKIEVRILGSDKDNVKIKFAAHDPMKFDRARIEEAKKLAKDFQLRCDMDGKMMM
ncbi:hypothetical protein ACLSU7_07000 [Bdellovibrio sp. HCB185ZH]|uniref:hypothetical protein n=1 Tax=Bdellovibrio sp. HCB185ZH TaxID=3394235 RepID=UPI0039A699F9